MKTMEASYADHHGSGKAFRQGMWRCVRDEFRMGDSFGIWQHLELFSKPDERTTRCVTGDIVFDCREHGVEEA